MTPVLDCRRMTSRREPGVTTWRERIQSFWECLEVEKIPRMNETNERISLE